MANELDAYKTEQTNLLEAQRAREKERAAINQQKLLKYLEQSSASKGYSVGMTESAKIAAANKYSQDVAAADVAYNQGVADLNNYVRDQQKAERDEIFNNVMTTIDSQTWNTTADLENYLYGKVGADGKRSGGVVNGLSDFQKAEIENRLNFYKGSPEQQAAEIRYAQSNVEVENERKISEAGIVRNANVSMSGYLDNIYAGNNFEIAGYNVELGDEVSDTTFTAAAESIPNKEPFTKDGKVFIKLNGKVYAVRNKGGNSVTGKNIDKIVKKLLEKQTATA